MDGEHTDQNICNYIQDVLGNWNITLDHVHVTLREIARNNKKHKQNKMPYFVFKKWIQSGTQHILY